MQAFIFADRLGRELEPLTDRTCVALLPVVGKPVLEHTLEALVAAGLRRAVIAVSPFAEELRAVIGDGRRWGMRLDYVLTDGEEEPEIVVERCPSRLEDEWLLLRGDVLHGAAFADFLRRASELAGPVAHGRVVGEPLSLCRHRAGGRGGLEPLRWSVAPSADSAALAGGGTTRSCFKPAGIMAGLSSRQSGRRHGPFSRINHAGPNHGPGLDRGIALQGIAAQSATRYRVHR